jgi:hypothetical protein
MFIDKWIEIKERLDGKYELNDETKEDWKDAVNIFSRRLQRYYITPINELKKGITGEGFPIVTAQCALIETFAAFKWGKVYKYKVQEDEIYYGNSGGLFVDFLNSEPLFLNNFSGNNPKADKFYTDVRCGLMHETRTKKDWVIKADAIKYANKHSERKKDITDLKGGGKNIIFRNQLQNALEKYFEQYKSNLRNPDDTYKNLRRFFARKLDHLCGNENDGSEWWSKS